MKKSLLWAFLIIILVAVIAVFLRKKPVAPTMPPAATLVTSGGADASKIDQPRMATNMSKRLMRPPGMDDAGWKYMKAMYDGLLSENQRIQFYARAVDQDGQPVSGARFDLSVSLIDEKEVIEKFPHLRMGEEIVHQAFTNYADEKGWIQFVGVKGRILGIENISKDGYIWRRPEGMGGIDFKPGGKRSFSGKVDLSDALNPEKGYTFHLWRKGVTEPLIAVNCSVPVQPFGTNWYAANLVTGEVNDFQNADFFFWFETITDSSGNPARRFKFKVLNGGMMIDAKPYPYRAPKSGYQSEWDWDYEPYGRNSRDDLSSLLLKKLYVKIRGGKVYGAIGWHWASENSVGINGYLNANGSLNLEPDAEKLIIDPEEIRRIDQQTRVP